MTTRRSLDNRVLSNKNLSLESIIKTRSTQRRFSLAHLPTKENIQQIIEAGIFAPFPSLGTNRRTNPRQFIVIQNNTPEWIELIAAITKIGKKLHAFAQKQPLLRILNRFTPAPYRVDNRILKQSEKYARMLAVHRGDFAYFGTAPFWIIVAERRHMPFMLTKLARQSLGHCLQNIWLKATELGMIVQPISLIYEVQNNKQICQMLGLKGRNWEMDSFLIGFPEKGLKPARRVFNMTEDIIWYLNQADEK